MARPSYRPIREDSSETDDAPPEKVCTCHEHGASRAVDFWVKFLLALLCLFTVLAILLDRLARPRISSTTTEVAGSDLATRRESSLFLSARIRKIYRLT
jgi:hypothetical protein